MTVIFPSQIAARAITAVKLNYSRLSSFGFYRAAAKSQSMAMEHGISADSETRMLQGEQCK